MTVAVHPRTALGRPTVYDTSTGECFNLSDGQAYLFAYLGMITYSPEDGPNARVYRLTPGVSVETLRRAVT